MPPEWAAPGLAVSRRHDAHLSPLWPARSYLCLTRSRCQKAGCRSLLRCFLCGWNGARDYAAAINIALLGVAFLKQSLATDQDDPSLSHSIRPWPRKVSTRSRISAPDWRDTCRQRPFGAACSAQERCMSTAGSSLSRCIPHPQKRPCYACVDSRLLQQLDSPQTTSPSAR